MQNINLTPTAEKAIALLKANSELRDQITEFVNKQTNGAFQPRIESVETILACEIISLASSPVTPSAV
jgi:hypothetical protein